MIEQALAYIDLHRERFIEELKTFLRFPSVSRQSAHKQDLRDCARWLAMHFEAIGLEARLIETSGHPIVAARTRGRKPRKLIIYGHYDVQPEDPLGEWLSPPFEPEVRGGFIYGRGSTDDKGQTFAHIMAVEALLSTGAELPCEIEFLIEGEEESDGHGLGDYVKNEAAVLACDAVVVSDTALYDERTPAITYGLRGLLGLEVIVHGPNRDVHSGSYGGAVPNPVNILAGMLARCVDAEGQVLIPGFYDDVLPVEPWERENFERLHYDAENLKRELELERLYEAGGYPVLERIWARPTFDVNGIYGGYMGEGGKTIIPSYAGAKITMRLTPGQDHERLGRQVVKFLHAICPHHVRLEIRDVAGTNPVLVDATSAPVRKAAEALREAFGVEPVMIREGGSIPVVKTFWEALGAPVILMGFGLHSDGAHSPNEHFSLNNLVRGAKASACLIGRF